MEDDAPTLRKLCQIEPSSNIAVIYHNGKKKEILTYIDFLDYQTQLSHQLEKIIPEDGIAVGIYSRPSLYLPVVVHTLINLSFTFVPLVIDGERNSFIHLVKMCGLKYVIVDYFLLGQFSSQIEDQIPSWKVQPLIGDTSHFVMVELEINVKDTGYQDVAYIVQSSGSTGKPKIIRVPGNCVMPNVVDLRSIFDACPQDMILIPSALTFDASIVQMLLTWLVGATMVIISEQLHFNAKLIASTLGSLSLSVIQCTPSFLYLMGNDLLIETLFHKDSKLRVLALGGERFPPKDTVIKWLSAKSFRLFNIYGTSEVSSWASIWEVSDEELVSGDGITTSSDWVPIGKPLSKTCIVIKNEQNEQNEWMKNGFGEIWIGGEERRCYVDAEEISGNPVKMRFSGDIGRMADGNIFFCGRVDSKIKHNGQMIDLDILSMVVNKKCDTCCLYEYSNVNNRYEIYLFVKPVSKVESLINIEAEILALLKKELSPAYIPENIIFVDNFAITPHGKIDKYKLRNHPCILMNHFSSYTVEKFLSHSWNAVLGLDPNSPIELSDNFVSCGGNSFTAVYLMNRVFRHVNSAHPNQFGNAVDILDCIFKGTFSDLLLYLNTIQTEDKNRAPKNREVLSETNENRATRTINNICYHFVAYQKQELKTSCSCSAEKVLSEKIYFPKYADVSQLMLAERWHYSLSKCIDASPLVVFNERVEEGIVYIGSHSHTMAAIRLNEGALVWEVSLGDRIESSAIMCCGGDLLAVGCYDGYLYFLKSINGEIVWKFFTGDTIKSSPLSDPYNNVVIVGSHGKKINALDLYSKKLLWVYHCDSSCFSTPCLNLQLNCVYVALLSGAIISLDIKSGDVLWNITLLNPVFSSPCLGEDTIFIGCVDSYLYSINFSGEIMWKYKTDAPIFSSPVYVRLLGEKLVIFGSNDQCMYCLHDNGRLKWKYIGMSSIYSAVGIMRYEGVEGGSDNHSLSDSMSNLEANIANNSELSLSTETSYISGQKHKLIGTELDYTRRKEKCKFTNYSSLKAFIAVAATNGELNILKVEDGSVVASHVFPGEIFSSPVIIYDSIIIGCRDDNVYMLKLSTSDG